MTLFLLFLQLALSSTYRSEVEKWRAAEDAALRSETGWLTLAGLAWLEEGENRIKMPKGAQDFGVFVRRGRTVILLPAGGGTPVEMRPDSSGSPTVLEQGRFSASVIERGARIGIRIRDRESGTRRDFKGMNWFPIRRKYRIEALWEPYNPSRLIRIANVLGDISEEKAPGRAVFRLEGKQCSLEPTESGGRLFFVFRDETSGDETYGGGRFLYAAAPTGGRVTLDFNRAVNPPCAFTAFATCPLPPRQNRLPVRIEAGELAPRAEDHKGLPSPAGKR